MNHVTLFLKENRIEYILHKHEAVFTCEDAAKHCAHIPGIASKNLLLKDKKNEKYFLVILPAYKKLDNRKIQELTSSKKIRFSNAKELDDLMKLTPGSVSPFGLINDVNNSITVLVDSDVWYSEIVSFHPNINNATIELSKDMFHKMMEALGNKYEIVAFSNNNLSA
jgi:Ala-tRNA(Pro) deacylase